MLVQMPPPATPRQMRSIVSGLRCMAFQQQRRDQHRRTLKGEFRSSQPPEERWQALPSSVVKVGNSTDDQVAGIHFYSLNRSDATRTIFDSLGIPRRRNPQVPTPDSAS